MEDDKEEDDKDKEDSDEFYVLRYEDVVGDDDITGELIDELECW